MLRVTINLTEDERTALLSMARDERRDPRAQAAIEIRRALERAGYLPIDARNSNGCAFAPPAEGKDHGKLVEPQ